MNECACIPTALYKTGWNLELIVSYIPEAGGCLANEQACEQTYVILTNSVWVNVTYSTQM